MHEVSHSLGPRTAPQDGKQVTISQALGESYSPIEEGKADITGLYNVVYLREHGVIDAPLEAHYAGWLSEALRSIRFGPASAYGLIRSAAWNWFVEKGALTLSPDGNTFHVDVDKMTEAVKELDIKLLTIEGEGDAAGAKAFLDQYSYVAPELQALLDKANAVVPIEFVPMYTPQTGETATTTTTTTTSSAPVPLKDAAPTMDPPAVWENFYSLTQVPRPSHHEEQATAFLSDFGKQLGMETTVDDVGNVIIRKPATPGMEDRPGVILQAHMDMVAQKTEDKQQDFETDPIDAYVEDGWVKADRTTLGADDGIGVATIMAILQDNEIAHPAIEALFTTNEEDGFTGINGLQPGVLQGSIYINVDWENEGSFCISSAGGVYVDANATYTEEEPPAGYNGLRCTRRRATGRPLRRRYQQGAWQRQPPACAPALERAGGTSACASPHWRSAPSTTPFRVMPPRMVVVSADQTDAFQQYVADFAETVKTELAATEPDMFVETTAADLPAKVMDADAQQALIGAVYGGPQGVMRMSDSVPDLVETSDSMGILSIGDGKFTAGIYVRSAVDSERDDTAERIAAVFNLAGADVTTHGAYSGWPATPDSPILALMQQTYQDLFGVQPEATAIHAGLETSVAGITYPGLDMISVGPTLLDVHSPDRAPGSRQRAQGLRVARGHARSHPRQISWLR